MAARVHLLPLALAGWLGGCSVLSPVPAWEALKAVGGAASLALAQNGASASQTVHHGAPAPSQVCIEWNPQTPVSDFVASLQGELRRHAIDSRLYQPGDGETSCQHWLRYQAYIDWDRPPWGGEQRPYLRLVQMALFGADGRVLASSAYVADGPASGRWASTQQKLQPVVTALVTGFAS